MNCRFYHVRYPQPEGVVIISYLLQIAPFPCSGHEVIDVHLRDRLDGHPPWHDWWCGRAAPKELRGLVTDITYHRHTQSGPMTGISGIGGQVVSGINMRGQAVSEWGSQALTFGGDHIVGMSPIAHLLIGWRPRSGVGAPAHAAPEHQDSLLLNLLCVQSFDGKFT